MNNNIKKLKKNRLNTKFRKIKKPENKKSTKSIVKIIIYIIIFFILISFVLIVVLYNKYLRDESIEELINYQVDQTSILYDRNWKELYRFFKEDRTYVDFDKISKNMINAIVSWEDKRYWENPGVDIIWLVRAGIYFLTWKSDSIWWTSTLTQQLIRNTIIVKKPNETKAEGIDRKIKEIFLSYNLTKSIPKEKILELYLNKIEFGHNSFGIESASKRFFNKSAIDLTPFEASILASIPKWPSHYSPYNHQSRLVWYIVLKDGTKNEKGKENITKLVSKEDIEKEKEIVNLLKEKISKLKWKEIAEWSNKYMICWVDKNSIKTKYKVDNDGCIVLDYSNISDFISYIEINLDNKNASYYPWRKDYILWRMLEDRKINFNDYKESVIKWIWYKFTRNKEKISAPHFVFYVKEILEEMYGSEVLTKLWLKIYTTLDLDLQKQAEELVEKQAKSNKEKFNAKNSALISIDNKTWGILAMVWNEDYFSDNWKWNVNVITSKLQPGSSFKPFVYSLAMEQNQIWTKTPVYDVEMTFPWNYKPKNFDGKYMGKITIATALNHSRNIPAIKMFYMTTGTKWIIDFMHKLWADSLDQSDSYGASLALWTWEMTPLDLAKAYSVFANMWEKVEITPILKIVDSKGITIKEFKEPKKEKVMPSGQAFLINNILSDESSRPAWWNNFLNIWRPVAVKTGTSTKVVKEKSWKEVQYPANLFVAWYTPQITTIVWSGNITWETMKYNGSWLEGSGPLWRDFMKYYHKWKEIEDWSTPKDIKKITVSEISGLLPNPEVVNNFLVSSYFINPPKKIDDSYKYVEYDALCNWKITNETPVAAIKKYVLLNLHSLKHDNEAWETPVKIWEKSESAKEKYGIWWDVVEVKDEVCKRDSNGGWHIELKSNILEDQNYNIWSNSIDVAFQSKRPLIKVEILINWELSQTININNQEIWWFRQNIFIPERYLNQEISIEIRAVDNEYFSKSEKKNIFIWNKSKINSWNLNENENIENTKNTENIATKDLVIHVTNPKISSIKINKEDYFNLRFNIENIEKLSNLNILLDNKIFSSLWNNWNYVIPINQTQKLDEGMHHLNIQATSTDWKIFEKIIQIEIL